MWPLPKIQHEFVSITLNETLLTCSWIRNNSKGNTPNTLMDYMSFPLHTLEYAQAIMFNPTHLQNCIMRFIQKNSLEHAYAALSVSGKNIIEAITTLTIASPKPTDFAFPKLRTLVWDYRYLYPDNNEQYVFYVCGITQPLLAQYQLMAMTLPLNLSIITTQRMSLITLYKHHYGATFRHSQLARDMLNHNNELHNLFTPETIRRNLIIKPSLSINIDQEKDALVTSLGLFYALKDTHALY